MRHDKQAAAFMRIARDEIASEHDARDGERSARLDVERHVKRVERGRAGKHGCALVRLLHRHGVDDSKRCLNNRDQYAEHERRTRQG